MKVFDELLTTRRSAASSQNSPSFSSLQATVAVFGRFHAFYLASRLAQNSNLTSLITTYPAFKAREFDVPGEKIDSLASIEIAKRLWRRLRPDAWREHDLKVDCMFLEQFEKKVAERIPDETNLFIGWSGSSELALRQAQRQGALTVLERGSAHIDTQVALLRDEYERVGIEPRLPPNSIIHKERREYAITDYIEVPSTFARRSFVERGVPEDKIFVGLRGVDLSEFRPVEREDNTFRVVFAGSMSLQKGVHYLLQAFSELNLPNAELWLLGGIRQEILPYFKKYEGDFKYFGRVPQRTLHWYYSQCDVFTLNSIQDGFGVVLLQAMACELPVIATTNTGAPDILDESENGFLIPIKNVEYLKDRLAYLYDNRLEARRMGKAARSKALSNYTWEDYGSRVRAIYTEIVGSAHQ